MKLQSAQLTNLDELLGFTPVAFNYLKIVCDFLTTTGDFVTYASGAGASFNITTSDPGGHPGILLLNTGTTTTGLIRVCASSTAGLSSIFLGAGVWRFETCFMNLVLSDSTNTYINLIGFNDASIPVDGVYFRYTSNENSGNWQACTTANSVTTSVDTGIPAVISNWFKFTIIVNISSSLFYINGLLVATITTNLPVSAGRQTGVWVSLLKTLGSTNASLYVDYVEVLGQIIR